MLLLVLKSQGILFDMPVRVAGYVRKDGGVVAPHMSVRRVVHKPGHQVAQTKLFDDAQDAHESPKPRRSKLEAWIDKRGGAASLSQVLAQLNEHQRERILEEMGKLGGKTTDEVRAMLGIEKQVAEVTPPAQNEPEPAPEPKPEEPVAGPAIVEHVTKKGKTLRGVIRTDLNGHEAAAIDPYTFRKDGGWFIREKHLTDAPAAAADAAAPAAPVAPAAVAEQKAAVAEAIDKSKEQAAKLRAAGEKLKAEAEADMGRERNANTARRARMAASADADARQRLSIAETMINLAGAIEAGDAIHLKGVSTRAAVETLDQAVRRAVIESDRELSYVDQQRNRGREPTPDDIRRARIVRPSWNNGGADKPRLLEMLKGKRGAKALMDRIRASNGPDSEIVAGLKKFLSDKDISYALGWWNADQVKVVGRLNRLGINTDDDLRIALAEYMAFRNGPKKADPVKEAMRSLVGQKVGIDFFPTPTPVAERMIEMAGIKPGMRVLEPSAGAGHIADAARAAGAEVDVVEVSSSLRDLLEKKGHKLAGSDFMEFSPAEQYDAVVMNPPFSNRMDATHIMRAWEMVKPGGRLVAIAGEGVFFGSDKTAAGFREWVETNGGEVEKLPENTFRGAQQMAQTGANSRLLVMEKPAAAAPVADAGPQEGDTKTEDGIEYVLRDGRWHRATPEEAAAPEPEAASEVTPAAEQPAVAAEDEPLSTDPDVEMAEDREDLAGAMMRDPHGDEAKQLLRKIAQRESEAHQAADEPAAAVVGGEDDPNSQNYRFRDTGYVAGSRKELAAENIKQAGREGRQLRATDIDWSEIEQNPRQAKDLIKKSNLFGTVDWQALREGGMEPGAGFLVDRVYASLATEPSGDNPQMRRDYAIGLESLRTRLESCKTADQVTAVLDEIRNELDGLQLNEEEARRYKALGDESQAVRDMLAPLKEKSDALYARLSAANAAVWQAENVVGQRRRRKWADRPEDLAALEQARAQQEAVNAEWSALRDVINPIEERAREQIRSTIMEREEVLKAAKIRNVVENQATRSWATMGSRFLGLLNWRRHNGSDAFAGHVTAAKRGRVTDWSWAEKEAAPAPRPTKREVAFQLKVAETLNRVGGRQVEVSSTNELKSAFGLREVQSGNWVLNDPASAAYHVQKSAEAFADLADLLNVDEKFVAMNGRLAMAFGARGTGNTGFGGAARAHYEPVHRVINLTKMGGGGSLGHEWFHALDNLVREAEGAGSAGKDTYLTEQPDLLPPGELRDAFQNLKDVINTGAHRMPEKHKYTAADVRKAKYNVQPGIGAYSSPIAQAIRTAGGAEAAVVAVDSYFTSRYGASASTGRLAKQVKEWRKLAVAYYGNPDGGEEVLNTGRGTSSFMREAVNLDGGVNGKYWSEGREMAARAFQSWIEDRLAAKGQRNDYLSVYADNKYHVDPLFGPVYPYPEGEERERLNAAFDRLVAALNTSGTLHKAMALMAA